MKNKIFKDGGGAGIGSYVVVVKDGKLVNADSMKIRGSFDNGETIYLSIIDDSTEEALLPMTGYVDNNDILHLIGRDLDDNQTYNLTVESDLTLDTELEIVDGITIGNSTLVTEESVQEQIEQAIEEELDTIKIDGGEIL